MHLTLEVKTFHQFYWLRAIRGVRIDKCCAECFNAVRDDRVFNATRSKSYAYVDIDIKEDPRAIAYYLCGLSAGFVWGNNSHVAFIPSKGENIEIDDNQMRLTITDARRIKFETYIPKPLGDFTYQQRRCRNWIFANYVKDGLLEEEIKSMEIEKIIELNERNIRTALADYARYIDNTTIIDDVSDTFIHGLASDNAYAKSELRELFRKSPVWDEQLEALVINGTRTHNPDPDRIQFLAHLLLYPAVNKGAITELQLGCISKFFADLGLTNVSQAKSGLETIQDIAPKAYAPGKKLSRVFKALCDALQITDATAGSEFQRNYAQFADELTAKKIGFKLFVSINPAHFLTMSNPKGDRRGSTLTSCHSFNSTEYTYNNGCSGYARDKTSFIVFTVEDATVPELFNNRKTTRQIFAYKPGNGVLLQSRLYNTSGGTRGAQEESKLYRDLVQREISDLEGQPNLWKTFNSYDSEKSQLVRAGECFGGYTDWTYTDFGGKISIRNDCEETCETIVVGEVGLCISCGEETDEGLYCEDCKGDYICDECEEHFHSSYDLYDAHDSNGNCIRICERCRDEYYRYCDECGEYYPTDYTRWVDDDTCVCDDCYDEYYEHCDDCDEAYRTNEMHDAVDYRGRAIRACDDCLSDHFIECDECGTYAHTDGIAEAQDEYGTEYAVCPSCRENVCAECVDCAQLFLQRALNSQGRCSSCVECAEISDEQETDEVKEDAV